MSFHYKGQLIVYSHYNESFRVYTGENVYPCQTLAIAQFTIDILKG